MPCASACSTWCFRVDPTRPPPRSRAVRAAAPTAARVTRQKLRPLRPWSASYGSGGLLNLHQVESGTVVLVETAEHVADRYLPPFGQQRLLRQGRWWIGDALCRCDHLCWLHVARLDTGELTRSAPLRSAAAAGSSCCANWSRAVGNLARSWSHPPRNQTSTLPRHRWARWRRARAYPNLRPDRASARECNSARGSGWRRSPESAGPASNQGPPRRRRCSRNCRR